MVLVVVVVMMMMMLCYSICWRVISFFSGVVCTGVNGSCSTVCTETALAASGIVYKSHIDYTSIPQDMSQHLRAAALIHASEIALIIWYLLKPIHNAVFSRCLLLHSITISEARRNIHPLVLKHYFITTN